MLKPWCHRKTHRAVFSYPPWMAVMLISNKFFARKTWHEHCTRKYNVRVPRGKIETIRPELPRMASLKNVHPCTFFSFEFSWWKTRYCLEPLTSCQYSDVLCTHKTRLQLLYTDVQQLKMVQMVAQPIILRNLIYRSDAFACLFEKMGMSQKFCFITDCIALTSHGAVVFFLFLIISTNKLKGYLPLCRFLFLFFPYKVLNVIPHQ